MIQERLGYYAKKVLYVWFGLILVIAGFALAIFPVLPGLPLVFIGLMMVAKHTGIIGVEKEKRIHRFWRRIKNSKLKDIIKELRK